VWLEFGVLFCFFVHFLSSGIAERCQVDQLCKRDSKGFLMIHNSNTALDVPEFCGQLGAKDLLEVMDSHM